MIALLARAQALGAALDPTTDGVMLGKENLAYDGGPSERDYSASVAGIGGAGSGHKEALAELVGRLRQAVESRRGDFAESIADDGPGPLIDRHVQVLDWARLLTDESDAEVKIQRKYYPASATGHYYNISVTGMNHETWAHESLPLAWGMAVGGLRAMARAKLTRLTEALVADDKAARS